MSFRAFTKRFLRIGIPALMIWALTAGIPSFGQDPADPSLLNLDRVLSPAEFAPEDSGRGQWLADSSGYTMLLPSKDAGGTDIVRCDAATGRIDILVPAGRLVPAGATAPLQIAVYEWSADGQKLLLQTNPKRVYHKTFADCWILDLKAGAPKKIGGDSAPSSLLNATLSPDGTRVAYVRDNNIYVEDVATGAVVSLTKDGTEDILNGTFDYVTEEEFFNTNGFRWSPDGKSIAYWQVDQTKVPVFSMINNTDSLYPKVINIKFSKPGQTIASGRIGVVAVTGGPTTWFDVPGDSADNYILGLEWAGNSSEVVFQHLNRNQNRNDVMLGDARTGATKTVYTDSDPAWLDIVRDFQWLDGGKEFLWVSEKDGWRHFYAVSRTTGAARLLTPGEFDVWEFAGIDAKNGWLYGICSPDNATQRYLYRFRMNGKGIPQKVSPADRPGTHAYDLSPDGIWAFHTYSTFAAPPITKLIRLAGHKEVRMIADNSKALKNLQGLKRGAAEFQKIDIGAGVVLDAWVMRPPDFDPQKKYPLLFYVYGEPWGSTVTDSWGGSRYLWHLFLTQQGYVVMSVDNRGTRVPRGRAWRKCIYKQVGILASADQAAAVKVILERDPSIDAARIGIYGSSGGGAMTLNALFRYPDVYRMGMAFAAPADQRYYNSAYQERYMGLPKDNPKGYEDGSPVRFAGQLKGNLLIAHGTGDDNVHYQNTEAVVNELIKANKPFTMMAYPNRRHGISEGVNTVRHRHELMLRYLKENLLFDRR
jgi:dipeptidyl-peptidase 4